MTIARKFGRLIQFDERSRGYAIRAVAAVREPRNWTWNCRQWLDQGQEGACAGFAMAHAYIARPRPGVALERDALAIYHRAQFLDEWPGEQYVGTSVLAAAKAAREKGWITSFRWCFGEPEVASTVSWVAPVVIGVPWYQGMAEPDAKGVIRPTGALLGGHATLLTGYNAKTRTYRVHNSWGTDYGRGGDAFIAADDLAALLRDQGEACVPVKA